MRYISVAFGASLLRNGQVRIIAVSAPKRLSGVLAEAPTWRDPGYDRWRDQKAGDFLE